MKSERGHPGNSRKARDAKADLLFEQIYNDLRRMARAKLRDETQVTLQPTELVHDVYVRMSDQRVSSWQGQTHVLAIAAQMMRRVILDRARRVRALRRGGDWKRVTCEGAENLLSLDAPEEAIWVDGLVEKLSKEDSRQGEILELRLYGGLSVAETAEVLRLSRRTVELEWTMIRAWIRKEVGVRDRKVDPASL